MPLSGQDLSKTVKKALPHCIWVSVPYILESACVILTVLSFFGCT